jgi:aspartyl-tRNA(Asn)/glutamyl-tRNA(Gln) amidotransferase subunit A
MSARAIAADVRAGRRTARSVAEAAIADIEARDGAYNSVTRLLIARAHADADAVDAQIAAGRDPGPFAGVPYGVKDLFEVVGLPTTAGAGMRADAPPALRDAEAIERMRKAGAVLVATLNMDEYAYGFATINAAHGTTRNPHDVTRLAGGSSGGSAAAVSAGLLPITLGSDTNGSIRVPASLTGIYGLKPSHGALPMAGVFPFADSFDDIGPFATNAADLCAAWSVLAGGAGDADAGPVRVARLGGWFRDNAIPEMLDGVDRVADALGGGAIIELPEVARARSAAFLMTAAEGGALHLPELRRRPLAFDPATRDRLIAGATLPASVYLRAQQFQSWFAAQVKALFVRHDVLIAPAVPGFAPPIDAPVIEIDGKMVPARAHLGIYTQPLSFVGLAVVTVPLLRPGLLPLGVQLVGAPGSETMLLALASRLEAIGVTGFTAPGAPCWKEPDPSYAEQDA